MKRIKETVSRAGACLLITLLFQTSGYSADPRQDNQFANNIARKIDEYRVGYLRSHDEQMRLWGVFDEFIKEPEEARLFIIAYGPLPGSARRHANRAKSYLVKGKGLIPARCVDVDGGYRAEPSVEIWIVPGGAREPAPKPTSGFEQTANAARKYDEFSLDGWWFRSDYEDKPERLDGFAAALQADSASRGYIVIRRGTLDCETCLTPGTEIKFAKEEKDYLVKKHQITHSRISIISVGKVDGGKMELWIAPKGARLPITKYRSRPRRFSGSKF